MTALIYYKLLAIFIAVAIGYVAGRMRWLGQADGGGDARGGDPARSNASTRGDPARSNASTRGDPARVMSNAAFMIFVPALLFRTTARLDFGAMPWRLIFAYFVPLLMVTVSVYLVQRWRAAKRSAGGDAADPSVRAVGASFGNAIQLGIPLATALFGEAGLGIHIALVSLHALVLLSTVTTLAELDLARAHVQTQGAGSLARTLRQTLRNTIIHPVILPVLAGMAWNLGGLPIPAVIDEVLQLLASAVVPLCLVLIGISLAYQGRPAALSGAVATAVVKLVVVPAAVLVVARWGFGLTGLPLAVLVTMAALPVGTNPLIFAQRYRTLEAETTSAIVISTVAYVVTAPLWLAVVTTLAG